MRCNKCLLSSWTGSVGSNNPFPGTDNKETVLETIWPQMLCVVPKDSLLTAKYNWRRQTDEDELLWHRQVAHACVLHLALQRIYHTKPGRELILAQLHHSWMAIRLLKNEIESLGDEPAAESLITSVLCMGIAADINADSDSPERHPSSPLATAQYMHLYGRMSFMPTYATALRYLVESRGGIHALNQAVLPDWLFL